MSAEAGARQDPAQEAIAAEPGGMPQWRRNALLLSLCLFLGNVGFALPIPFVPLILAELGATSGIERLTGTYSVVLYTTTMLLMPLWGGLADHFGKRSMMLRATLGQLVVFCAMAFAPNVTMLMVLVAGVGAANGFNAASQSLIVTNTPAPAVGRALATIQIGTVLGATLGPALAGVLASVLPAYRWLYLVGGLLNVGSSAIVLLWVREVHVRPMSAFRLHVLEDLRLCLRRPTMGVLYFLMFLFACTYFGSVPVGALYLLELLEGGDSYLGVGRDLWLSATAGALMLSSAVALPLWGRLLDRYELRRLTLIGQALCVAVVLAYPFVQNPLQLTLVRLVVGALVAGLHPALLRLAKDAAPPGMEARALAFGTSVYMLGHGFAPWLAGELAPWIGLRGYFWVHAGLVGLGLLLWALRGVRRPPG